MQLTPVGARTIAAEFYEKGEWGQSTKRGRPVPGANPKFASKLVHQALKGRVRTGSRRHRLLRTFFRWRTIRPCNSIPCPPDSSELREPRAAKADWGTGSDCASTRWQRCRSPHLPAAPLDPGPCDGPKLPALAQRPSESSAPAPTAGIASVVGQMGHAASQRAPPAARMAANRTPRLVHLS